MAMLTPWVVHLTTKDRLYRFETEASSKDKHKFFAYYRNKKINPWEVAEGAWGGRCRDKNCGFKVVYPRQKLRLIAIPYKTVMMEHEVTNEDEELAALLLKAEPTPTEHQRNAINHLILQHDAALGRNLDYDLIDRICALGYDGFIRVMENTEEESIVKHIQTSADTTHPGDEVALCNADAKVYTVFDRLYRPAAANRFPYRPFVDLGAMPLASKF